MKRHSVDHGRDRIGPERDRGPRSRAVDRRARESRERVAERCALGARVLVGLLHLAAAIVWHASC